LAFWALYTAANLCPA